MSKQMERTSALRVICTILGAFITFFAVFFDHPSHHIPVWFGVSCALGAVGLLVSLLALRESAVRGIAVVATVAALGAMVLSMFFHAKTVVPMSTVPFVIYAVGIALMAPLPFLIERWRKEPIS